MDLAKKSRNDENAKYQTTGVDSPTYTITILDSTTWLPSIACRLLKSLLTDVNTTNFVGVFLDEILLFLNNFFFVAFPSRPFLATTP